MQPRSSEIFDLYVQEIEKTSITKEAKEKESPELKKYKSDTHPRSGSDDLSIIENLYHTKPEQIKGMEYDQNIIEIAHPNPVVIAPSYDKLNGLVENQNEQANIIRNILMNDPLPSGTIRFKKRAQQELAMELMKIANDLDNSNNEELRVLADDCLIELTKEAGGWSDFWEWMRGKGDEGAIGEGAITGMGVGTVIGALLAPWTGGISIPAGSLIGGAAGGILSSIFNTTPKVKNVKENAKDLLDQLADLEKSVPEQVDFWNSIKTATNKTVEAADKYLSVMNFIRGRMMENEQIFSNEQQESARSSQELVSSLTNVKKLHDEFNTRAKQGQFAKGVSNITPWYQFGADDIKDVSDSFVSLEKAIMNLSGTMTAIGEKAKEKAAEGPAPQSKEKEMPQNKNESGLFDYLKAPEGLAEKTREFLGGIGKSW